MTLVFLFAGAILAFATDFNSGSWWLVVVVGLIGAGFDIRNVLKAAAKRTELGSKISSLEATVASLQNTVKYLDTRINTLLGESDETIASDSTNLAKHEPETTSIAPESNLPAPTEADQPETSAGAPPQSENATSPPSALLASATPAEQSAYPAVEAPEPPGSGALLNRLLTLFTGGNTVARVGIVLLTIGLGFLVQVAAREGWLPIQLRLAGAGLVGVALVMLGWRLRQTRAAYALSLQGGGVGVMYLTIFAAIQVYNLIPNTLGFGLLVLVAVAAAVLAVVQDAMVLAVLGAVGGFLAPFFAAGEAGSHLVLFSYYLVLNIGILLIAWHKVWRPLNLVGFVGTFIAGTLWGGLTYRAELFATTEPFLLLFFAMYLALAVLYALRQAPKLRGLMDSSLVFGLPVLVFGLQVALVRRFELGIALSALAFAAIYLLLAFVLYRRAPRELALLAEAFTGLGIIFTALVLPFAFDASWTTAGWALGAAGLVWIGVRQQRAWLRLFGLGWHLLALVSLFLQFIAYALFSFLLRFLGTVTTNTFSLDSLATALALLFSAYMLYRAKTLNRWERMLSPFYMALGLGVWTVFGMIQANRLPGHYEAPATLAFLALTTLLCQVLAKRLEWHHLNRAALALPLIATLFLGALLNRFSYAFHTLPLLMVSLTVWVLTVAIIVLVLRRSSAKTWLLEVLYALSLWLVGGVLVVHGLGFVTLLPGLQDWSILLVTLPFTALVWLMTFRSIREAAWLHTDVNRLLLYGVAPLAAALWLGGFLFNTLPPFKATLLPYLPVLNPVDMAIGLALVTLVGFLLALRQEVSLARPLRRALTWALIALGLFWTSGIIARTVHYWLGVPYTFDALFDSNVLQTSLSIFWSLFALLAMLLARRLVSRTPWLVGAGLLAVVVLKLFLVELAGVSAVARIISFIGVGVLLLLIGYLAPLPPAQQTEEVVS